MSEVIRPSRRQPTPWPTARLGDVCTVVNGSAFPTHLQGRSDLPYPFVKVSDMNALGAEKTIDSAANTVDDDLLKTLSARLCPAGTVVLPKVGGALMTNKKRILGTPAAFDNNVLGVVPKDVETDWLYHWLLTVDLRTMANTQAMPSIRKSEIEALRVPMPPARERRAIMSRLEGQLDAAASMRAAAAGQLKLTDSVIESELQEAFRGITPLSAGDHRDGAPRGWKWQRLLDLARLESGHTPSRRHPEWWSGSIPWLALPDIRELDCQVATETLETTNDLGIAHSSARVLPQGTVVLSRTASVGFVATMGRPMATSQDFVNWVCGPDLDPAFLMYLLRASRQFIRRLSSGAIHKTVYVPTVKAFHICAPGIDEQKRIADVIRTRLTAVGSIRERLASQSEEVDRLPTALLRHAFSRNPGDGGAAAAPDGDIRLHRDTRIA